MKAYTESIPLETKYIKLIINAIENADFLYNDYVKSGNFPTHNGESGEKWNYINKIINDSLPADRFQIKVMSRPGWQFIGIYDRANKYLYTLMRDNNLNNLRKKREAKLFHYTNALSKLNAKLHNEFELECQQISLFSVVVDGS